MTPCSSASSDNVDQGAKPWMIPQFKSSEQKNLSIDDKEASTPPNASQGNRRHPHRRNWDSGNVFRSPSTEFLHYLRKRRIVGGNGMSDGTESCAKQMACLII
eukprot:CAMPEP_0184480704 /NCGR_PEP_ID=MMETSP0113_2-20130426/2217_1 /TAXON_ID=91329 /ORGANISM="Norrisiella sphaerica, Strain BC52" /LENGTH=102 /DNA_ID=CAMNT_0026859357 /DNA_START=406 /DNA_END=714 /DNA_ORIENTATION=+